MIVVRSLYKTCLMFTGLMALSGAPAFGQDAGEALPEPLTLEHALSLAEADHPEMVQLEAELAQARAVREGADAGDNFRASVQGRVSWYEPSTESSVSDPSDGDRDDHHVGLFVSKRLYDFGRTDAAISAAEAEVESRELLYADGRTRRRLDILDAYFDVLLADLRYIRDNEAMAVAYVNYDDLQDEAEQGRVSDIEVLRSETEYQEIRRQRYASDVARRAARSRLALLLNRPGSLPSTLVEPQLPGLKRELPEVNALQERALKENPRLKALRRQVEAARQRIEAARADKYPLVRGEMEASEYTRKLGSRDRLRAGITFEVPLYTGGAVDSEIGVRQAQFRRSRAELMAAEMDVRQAVLDLWNRIYVLRAQRDEAFARTDYRDLYLSRSRALYELDVETDLGDSMVEFSAARLFEAQTRYELALALARMDALLGKAVQPTQPPEAPESGGNNETP